MDSQLTAKTSIPLGWSLAAAMVHSTLANFSVSETYRSVYATQRNPTKQVFPEASLGKRKENSNLDHLCVVITARDRLDNRFFAYTGILKNDTRGRS